MGQEMSEAWSQWEGHVVNERFHLKKYLGGSEQNAVFLTEEPGPDPYPAAIKLVACDPVNKEVQLPQWGQAQRLSHPHLLRILDTGCCRLDSRELIFAVMEYAEENLAQILPERSLTPREARALLEPTLEALGYLHGQGFVHGHLKPANLLAVNDHLKLASDSIRQAGETVSDPGNPSDYDAPEVPGGVISPAADIWSLGMTLVQVLTQRLPFWDKNDQADPVVPKNLPAPFLGIAQGCLRRDPQQRWTVAAIAAALRAPSPQPTSRVAESAPSPQRPQPVRPKPGSWAWRSAFPIVVTILGVGALFAGFGFLNRHPASQPDTATPEPKGNSQPQEPVGGNPSSRTKSKPSPQSGSGGNRLPLPAPPAPSMKPQPASLRSEAQPPRNGGSESGVVHQVLPNVPQTASDTIQGTVKVTVKVNVDPSGNVEGAELDSAGPSKYFARLALQAAQSWKFASFGQGAGREFVLTFEFRNDGTRAFATPSRP